MAIKPYQDHRNYQGDRLAPGENLIFVVCLVIILLFVLVAVIFG